MHMTDYSLFQAIKQIQSLALASIIVYGKFPLLPDISRRQVHFGLDLVRDVSNSAVVL